MKYSSTIIDSHTHLWKPEDIGGLNAVREGIGADRMGIASIVGGKCVNDNPPTLAAKALYPEKFYIFLGLDHSAYLSSGEITTPSLVEQLDFMIDVGADGIKFLETKPQERKAMDIPIDSDYYDALFARLEETGFPVIWHVADPEEFWDPELTPDWAKAQGWGYDETYVPKEQFYTEVSNVLIRHPGLKVTFAHFYFLSADLPRASALMDRFPNINFDLAPGIEMLYNLSRDPAAAREFFIKYSDRIIFGTDSIGNQPVEVAKHRADMVYRWLESTDEFRVGNGADRLLGSADAGVIRGMDLPEDVLSKIYMGNFERVVGLLPRRLNKELAIDECERIAREIELFGGDPAKALTSAAIIRG